MPKKLPDIEYGVIKDKGHVVPFVDSNNSLYQIPFYKQEDYFSNIDSLSKFVKACESRVRSSDRYTKYKKYLMTEAEMNHCQVFKNIHSEDADIEMHHGPVFTLFDYCYIVIFWMLAHNKKITTFRVADAVLTEHEDNHVQVVMLSTTIHQEVHARNIFIHEDQAFGDLNAFIHKYGPLPKDMVEKMNRYIDRCMVSESNDFGLLDLTTRIIEAG